MMQKPFPKISISAEEGRKMLDQVLNQSKNSPFRKINDFHLFLPSPQEDLKENKKKLVTEIYKQTLEIQKLRSDNKILAFELESVQNELKVQKFKNSIHGRSELISRKSQLDNLLRTKSRELQRKKILALELQKELKLLRESHGFLTSYLYEIRKIYGNLDLKKHDVQSAPATRRNRSQD
jgi:hypothetical protein